MRIHLGVMKAFASRLRGSTSGLPDGGRDDALYDEEELEEKGRWFYVVTDKEGITPRRVASYDKTHKLEGVHYPQGTVLEVVERLKRGWTTWLLLKHAPEWVFDVSPKDKKVRMFESSLEKGLWQYEATAAVQIVPRPYVPVKKGPKVTAGEAIKVNERLRCISSTASYLRLVDGRGWICDQEAGQQVVNCGDSSLCKALPHNQAAPEIGQWHYMVVDSEGVQLRSNANPSAPICAHLEEGEVVLVTEKLCAEGFFFLKLSDGTWGFDTDPKVRTLSMMEVTVERGDFKYQVVAPKGVALRARASFSATAKAQRGPDYGAVIDCCERVRCGETAFLKLSNGSGWVFDKKNGKKILEPLSLNVAKADPTARVDSSYHGGDLGSHDEGFELGF